MQTFINNDQRWALVLGKDLKADGQFVYAVKSTGIFCRPSCPSRRPRREQVEFFDSPADAQQAGYRACRRCAPHERNAQLQKVEAARRYIDAHMESALSLEEIARHVRASPFHFQRMFKKVLGMSPRQYQQARRAGKFKQALQTEPRITDAIYEAGYSSSSRAYETANGHLGMTPTAFRRKGEGVKISYAIIASELGKVLVATTPRGVCSVRFGQSNAALLAELRQEFQAAEIVHDERALAPVAGRIRQLLAGAAAPGLIPLDVQGTAFQQQVWNALRQIPPGQTRTYAEIAQVVGRPRAVRAVANACASNPVAVVVPCHRVVQKTGKLAGYRWGVERKAALLRRESGLPAEAVKG